MPRDAAVFDYTDLKPFLTKTVLTIAAERFPHRFSETARRLYLEKDPVKCQKRQLTRELFKVFYDAMGDEDASAEIRADAVTVRKIEDYFVRDDGVNPIFQLHVNGDMLFIAAENHDHRNQDGEPEPQLSVIGLIPIRDGKPDLSRLSRARNTCRAPQYGRKGGGR